MPQSLPSAKSVPTMSESTDSDFDGEIMFLNHAPTNNSLFNNSFTEDEVNISVTALISPPGGKIFKVIVTHTGIPQEAIDKLETMCKLVFIDPKDNWKMIKIKTRGMHGIFLTGNLVDVNRAFIKDMANANLKVVATMNHNYENMDVVELAHRKIRIGTTRSIVYKTVAELAIALALAVSHRLMENHFDVRSKIIDDDDDGDENYNYDDDLDPDDEFYCLPHVELFGSTCGIVGQGDLVSYIAEMLGNFKCKRIFQCNPGNHIEKKLFLNVILNEADCDIEKVEFSELVSTSDFIFVTCRLVPATLFLFNLETFKQMKRTAILVDVSNEGVVNDNHLATALHERMIYGAGLDVTFPRILPQDHPLLNLKNCLVTPRIASASLSTRMDMAVMTANNVLAGLANNWMPSEVCFKRIFNESRANKPIFSGVKKVSKQCDLRPGWEEEPQQS